MKRELLWSGIAPCVYLMSSHDQISQAFPSVSNHGGGNDLGTRVAALSNERVQYPYGCQCITRIHVTQSGATVTDPSDNLTTPLTSVGLL